MLVPLKFLSANAGFIITQRKLCAPFGRLGALRFRRYAPHPRITATLRKVPQLGTFPKFSSAWFPALFRKIFVGFLKNFAPSGKTALQKTS